MRPCGEHNRKIIFYAETTETKWREGLFVRSEQNIITAGAAVMCRKYVSCIRTLINFENIRTVLKTVGSM